MDNNVIYIVLGILGNIVLGVISSIIFEFLKPAIPFINRQSKSDANNTFDESRTYTDPGVYERRRLSTKRFFAGIFLYIMHAVFVLAAFNMTVGAIKGFDLYLDQARFVGQRLPHIRLEAIVDFSSSSGFLMFLMLVIGCFLFALIVALPFIRIGAYYGHNDRGFRLSAVIMACLFTYAFLAAHIAWLFTALNYLQVWVNVGIIYAIWWLIAYILSRSRKKR